MMPNHMHEKRKEIVWGEKCFLLDVFKLILLRFYEEYLNKGEYGVFPYRVIDRELL